MSAGLARCSSPVYAEDCPPWRRSIPELYLPRYHKMDALIDELKAGLDAEAVEEVFVSMLGYYAAKADSLLHTPAMNIVQDLQTWAVDPPLLRHQVPP
jgi:hypothetical protein